MNFVWKTSIGVVTYDEASEKWLVNGDDEGQMSPPLARVFIAAIADRGIAHASTTLEGTPSDEQQPRGNAR